MTHLYHHSHRSVHRFSWDGPQSRLGHTRQHVSRQSGNRHHRHHQLHSQSRHAHHHLHHILCPKSSHSLFPSVVEE